MSFQCYDCEKKYLFGSSFYLEQSVFLVKIIDIIQIYCLLASFHTPRNIKTNLPYFRILIQNVLSSLSIRINIYCTSYIVLWERAIT